MMSHDSDFPEQAPQPEAEQAGNKLGERLRHLRKEAGWTLQDLARRCGVSLSTLSKIENAQVAPTFDTLVKAARGLGISFETLLADATNESSAPVAKRTGGRLMVTRQQHTVDFTTPKYEYHVHANGLRRKFMTPLIMDVKARTLDDVANWSSHEGEEFILILSGTIELHTEFYEPVRLEIGDSAYIDSGMAHMFLNVGDKEARMASVCYSDSFDNARLAALMPAAETGTCGPGDIP